MTTVQEAGARAHRSTHKVRLVIYPGESKNAKGVVVGHVYVINGGGERYEIAGGPPPGDGPKKDPAGGHIQAATPAGTYIIDAPEHHVSYGWPMSVIPWGAKLREHNGQVEYQSGSQWRLATGPRGEVTHATRD